MAIIKFTTYSTPRNPNYYAAGVITKKLELSVPVLTLMMMEEMSSRKWGGRSLDSRRSLVSASALQQLHILGGLHICNEGLRPHSGSCISEKIDDVVTGV